MTGGTGKFHGGCVVAMRRTVVMNVIVMKQRDRDEATVVVDVFVNVRWSCDRDEVNSSGRERA